MSIFPSSTPAAILKDSLDLHLLSESGNPAGLQQREDRGKVHAGDAAIDDARQGTCDLGRYEIDCGEKEYHAVQPKEGKQCGRSRNREIEDGQRLCQRQPHDGTHHPTSDESDVARMLMQEMQDARRHLAM